MEIDAERRRRGNATTIRSARCARWRSTALTRLASDPRSQAVFEVMLHESDSAGEMAPLTERKQRERRHCLTHVERVLQQAVSAGSCPATPIRRSPRRRCTRISVGMMHSWVLDPAAYDLARSGARA